MKPIKIDIKKMGACVLSTSLVMSTAQTLLSNFALNSSFLAYGESLEKFTTREMPTPEEPKPTGQALEIDPAENKDYSLYFNLSRGINTSTGNENAKYVGTVDGFSKKAIKEIAEQKYSSISLAFPTTLTIINPVNNDDQSYNVEGINTHAFDAEMTKEEFNTYIVNSPSNLRIISNTYQTDEDEILTADDYNNYIAACKKINKLVFSASQGTYSRITYISPYAFRGCFSLDNEVATDDNGKPIYTKISSENEQAVRITLPQTLISIGTKAFADCYNLTRVTMPETTTTISGYAFENCYNLSQVTLGADFETADKTIYYKGVKYIGDKAFACCESLKELSLPVTLESLGSSVFSHSGIEKLDLPVSLKTIPNSAFVDCPNLKTVNLGSNTTTIGDYAFSGCKALESIAIPATVTKIGANAFGPCQSKTSSNNAEKERLNADKQYFSTEKGELEKGEYEGDVLITKGLDTLAGVAADASDTKRFQVYTSPEFVKKLSFTEKALLIKWLLYYGALANTNQELDMLNQEENKLAACTSLTKVDFMINNNFETQLKEIAANAFKDCSKLTALNNIDCCVNLTTIGADAFNGCSSLIEMYFPAKVKNLGNRAFKGCSKLKNVWFADNIQNLKTIPESAFYGCESLETISIPQCVTEISGRVNYGEDAESGAIPKDCYGAFAYSGLQSITFYADNYATLKTIGQAAFFECKDLKSITIPESVTTIGDHAFDSSGLKSIEFNTFDDISGDQKQPTLNTIGVCAFARTPSLKTITIPTSVTTIANHAFAQSGLTKISFAGGKTSLTNNTITEYSFANCSSLTLFEFPDSITTIQGFAFNECASLKTLKYPESIATVEEDAFANCPIKYAILPQNLKNGFKGNNAYGGEANTVLELHNQTITDQNVKYELDVSNSNTNIGSPYGLCATVLGFVDNEDDSHLKISETISVEITAGYDNLSAVPVKKISANAFKNCKHLTKVTLPKTIETIGDSAFEGCNKLSSIVYTPTTETSIQICQNAFKDCLSLNTVPDKLFEYATSFGNYSFYNCPLTTVTISGKTTSIGNYAFAHRDLTPEERGEKKADSTEEKADSTEEKTDSTEEKADSAEEKTDSAEEKTDSAEEKADSAEEKADSTEEKADSAEEKADSAEYIQKIKKYVEETRHETFQEYMKPGTSSQIARITIADNGGALTIGEGAFYGAFEWYPTTIYNDNYSSAATLTIPLRVTSIGQKAFYSLFSSACDTITINGNGKTTIGDEAFANATGCEHIILSNVKSIGTNAFAGAIECETITLSNVDSIGTSAFVGAIECETITLNNVNSIGNYAFAGANNCETLGINGSTSIGDYAFYHTGVFEISSLTLEGVTSIGAYAFAVDPKVKGAKSNLYPKIILPETVTIVGQGAFSNIPRIEYIFFKKDPEKIDFAEGALDGILIDTDKETLSDKIKFKEVSMSINYNGPGAKGKATYNYTLYNEKTETVKVSGFEFDVKVAIPADYATLTGITVENGTLNKLCPANSHVQGYRILESISIDVGGQTLEYPIKDIGNNAFEGLSTLNTVIIPDNITKIGDRAFAGCTGLTSLSLPKTIKYIGDEAFSGTGLSSVTLELSLAKSDQCTFGLGIFSNCQKLTSVDFKGFIYDNMDLKINVNANNMFLGSKNVHLYIHPSNFFDSSAGLSVVDLAEYLAIDNQNVQLFGDETVTSSDFVLTNTGGSTGGNTGSNTGGNTGNTNVTNQNGYGGQNFSQDSESGETASARLFENVTTKSLETDTKLSDLKMNSAITSPLLKVLGALGDKAISYVSEIVGQLPTPPSFTLSNECLGKTAYITFISSTGEVATKDPTDPSKTIWLTKEEVEKLSKEDYEKLVYQKIENLKNPTFKINSSGSIYAIVTIK